MNVAHVATLYAFNRWANARALAMVRPLAPHEFTADLRTSHGSIHGTLVHVLWAEWIWLERWRGESPQRVFGVDDYPDVEAIEAAWRGIAREQDAFIGRLTDARLAEPLTYVNVQGERWTYPLGHMLQHVVNHSTYHRGQIVTLLRQLGRSAEPTDFLVFFDEAGDAG